MNRICKTISISAMMLAVAPGVAAAQSCKSATKVASDVFNQVGTEAVALGCAAVKVALNQEGEFTEQDLLACYKDANFYTDLAKGLTGWWNTKVARNTWATLGPRHLETDKNLDGKLVGTSGRMFISFPMENPNATITITERDGKAKTSVVVCKHLPDGKEWTEVGRAGSTTAMTERVRTARRGRSNSRASRAPSFRCMQTRNP